jgi:hypothetical protein
MLAGRSGNTVACNHGKRHVTLKATSATPAPRGSKGLSPSATMVRGRVSAIQWSSKAWSQSAATVRIDRAIAGLGQGQELALPGRDEVDRANEAWTTALAWARASRPQQLSQTRQELGEDKRLLRLCSPDRSNTCATPSLSSGQLKSTVNRWRI